MAKKTNPQPINPKPPNWPSKTPNPSGPGRDVNPPKSKPVQPPPKKKE